MRESFVRETQNEKRKTKKNDREGEARSFYGERRIWFGVYGGNLQIDICTIGANFFKTAKIQELCG